MESHYQPWRYTATLEGGDDTLLMQGDLE